MPGRAWSPTRNSEASASADPQATSGAPRWVKAFVIVGALVLLLLFAIEHLVFERLPGGGMGKMGAHAAPATPGASHTTPSGVGQ